jgi:hypothetical protein
MLLMLNLLCILFDSARDADAICSISDSSNSGGENMYTMMKPVPGGNMPGVSASLILNFDQCWE